MDRQRIRLFSASIPCINDLRCIIGRISLTEIENSSITSLYHRRILMCRLLIYLSPDVIASPITRAGNQGDIYILTRSDNLSIGKIKSQLNDLNIQYSETLEIVTQRMYEACLHYTIIFRVSPQWNKVDQYLIQGKYFLSSLGEPKNAVKMTITITDEQTRLSVSPASVKIPALSLGYFNLSPRIIQNFMNNDDGFITLDISDSKSWVYVLPSLKKGKVMSISKKIPETSPFQDYEQLRRHWKNMYGYRLPDTDNQLIYYQIYFPGLGGSFYTYPNYCVRSNKLEHLRPGNFEDSADQFLRDLTEKLPKVCGDSLILQELHNRPSCNKEPKVVDKENIPNMIPWVTCNAGRILNRQETLRNDQRRLNSSLKLSGNYIHPFDTSYRDSFPGVFDNSGSSGPARNVIKDKNLREALNMKPFLRVQSANRKGLPLCSNKFLPVIGNTRLAEGSNILQIASSSYNEEQRLGKIETSCSSQSTKTDPDESLAAKQAGEENESFYHSLLRSRSSFDLNDFGTALGGEKDGNLVSNAEENGVGKEVEIRSHYFENLENQEQNNEKDFESYAKSCSKLKLYRLSNGKKLATQRVSRLTSERKDRLTVNFNTKDISSYFREREQVKVSDVQETVVKNSARKLIQTQLNIKRSGQVELTLENKKLKLIGDKN